jgi:hypothetical protein
MGRKSGTKGISSAHNRVNRLEATTRFTGFGRCVQKTTTKPETKLRRPKAAKSGRDWMEEAPPLWFPVAPVADG